MTQICSTAWSVEYAPDVISTERRYPEMSELAQAGGTAVELVPIPLDCTDGFNEAYYGRPEELLVAGARAACSAWSFVEPAQAAEYTAALGAAIDSGEWDAKYGALRQQPTFDGSLVIVRATP